MKTIGTRNRTFPERREEILRAACAVFVRDGFHAASMKDICAGAGLSPGSVYRYFPSKEEIIVALVDADHARWLAAMGSLTVGEGLLPALRALADLGLRDLESKGFLRLWVETAAEAARNPRVADRLVECYRTLEGRLATLVQEARSSGTITSDADPRLLARLIFAAFDGLILRSSFEPGLDTRAVTQGFLDFIGGAVGARPAGVRRRR
jgi:AcrR family transcriptional regulator